MEEIQRWRLICHHLEMRPFAYPALDGQKVLNSGSNGEGRSGEVEMTRRGSRQLQSEKYD
jgi:hypothetical protein